jgi:hypothetical protein
MPRGPLPALPIAAIVVSWPAVVTAVSAATFALASNRATARARAMPEHADATARLHRFAMSLAFLAVLEATSTVARILPVLVGGDLGDGRLTGLSGESLP